MQTERQRCCVLVQEQLQLYELSKKRRWSEAICGCILEEVLEEGCPKKGFTLRKTTFSLCCTVGRRPGCCGRGGDRMGAGISRRSFILRLEMELEDNLV